MIELVVVEEWGYRAVQTIQKAATKADIKVLADTKLEWDSLPLGTFQISLLPAFVEGPSSGEASTHKYFSSEASLSLQRSRMSGSLNFISL